MSELKQDPIPKEKKKNPAPRQATSADAGWRARQSGGQENVQNSGRRATSADAGWRTQQGSQGSTQNSGRRATNADAGWRAQAMERLGTQADAGWRSRQNGGQQSGGRGAVQYQDSGDPKDLSSLMGQATADAFSTPEEFKDAMARLEVLDSVNDNQYGVKGVISRSGGESIILLCSAPEGHDVVAKVYREAVNSAGSSIAARTKVLEFMGTEAGVKYTLAVQDVGLVSFGSSKYYFEIIPYCPDGDMSKLPPLSFEDIEELTQMLNEGLHAMHESGILHRDIKPDNLYVLEGRAVLGDFGVAKLAGQGATSITVGTDGYRAPESVLAVSGGGAAFYFDEKSDYYSMGVTLGSLFEGHYIYENMDAAMMTVAVRNGRLPLSRQDPHREELENLLNGLCRFDSRFRFGYEDVKAWLQNHEYTGGIMEEDWTKSYHLRGKSYRDEKSLFQAITSSPESWEEAKNHLFSKYFESFFRSFRTDIASAAQTAEETYRRGNRDKGLAVFLKSLYLPGPIVWRGYTFRGLQELAQKMAATKNPENYADLLKQRCVSHWLRNTEGVDVTQDTLDLVDTIERYSDKMPLVACYWFGNAFSGSKQVTVCGRTAGSFRELTEALFRDPYRFYTSGAMEMVMDMDQGAALYGFLFSLGCKEIVEKGWKHAEGCNTFDKLCFLLSMFELIAQNLNLDPSLIRQFYLDYGPVGIATYTQKLVTSTSPRIYEGLDVDGKTLLARIGKFTPSKCRNLEEAHKAYVPLMEDVDKLRRCLVGNPFCIQAGAYENRGVACCSLMGCFAFEIFGTTAPLGFSTQLGYGKGGK